MRRALLLASLILSLAACGGGSSEDNLTFQSLQEQLTRSFPAGTYVFRSQAEMASAWTAAPQEYGEPQPLPVIDFANNVVVGISLGVGIRCNVPLILRVTSDGARLLVSYRTNEGTGVTTLACLHTWRLTDFAAVPATGLPVEFVRVTE